MSTQSIEEIVRRMAREHFEIEEGIERIIWFKNGKQNEIHVIEVNRNTIPEGAILTFYLRPTQEIPVPIILGDITPEEWERVKRGSISLPEGWSLNDIEIFEREEVLQLSEAH
ncbi:hypothetical protein L0337_27805 [candidate division KSB1 bacterium]|nr:hypothetical protein [candidate division KSB1 bacterium]